MRNQIIMQVSKWLASARVARVGLMAGVALATMAGERASAQGFWGGGFGGHHTAGGPFERIASFPVFLNTGEDSETVAEIVAASDDGNTLIYTDGATGHIGFVDITDPYSPQATGVVALSGEPTSVAVLGQYALACVNTSVDFVNTSGDLVVIDIATRQIVQSLPLGGQPDAIAISPGGDYAAICIENERDEDLGDGEPPQMPAGFLVIVDTVGAPASWSTRDVSLVGIADVFPEDPEPEFVDINDFDVAVVTLQENNHIVLVRLQDGQIVSEFSAGTVNLNAIDTNENDLIEQTSALMAVPREPDAVTWTSNLSLATADEGDLFGGSRGFTTFFVNGWPLYKAGNRIEHEVARLGHYPEARSENKGNEPEGVEYGKYGSKKYLFVGSERANLVLVYELLGGGFFPGGFPVLRQALPTGVGPEGLLAIPQRDLFVVASEKDERGAKFRSTLMIYKRTGQANYPTIVSRRQPGSFIPIPWGALSGLATHPQNDQRFYAVHDSFYSESRIFEVKRGHGPATIRKQFVLEDANGVLEGTLNALKAALPASATADFDVDAIVNADGTCNLDPEGIAIDADGDFWLASEGRGNLDAGVSDAEDRPFESPNALVRVTKSGGSATIEEVVLPPLSLTQNQLRFGFEGVAAVGDKLYVAFQRAWSKAGDPSDRARIGCYDRATGTWGFAYYPLDTPTSPNGGWVGLSELTYLGDGEFSVIERDNQGGVDARIKRVYSFSVAGLSFQPDAQTPNFDVISKGLELDLVAADTYGPTGGMIPEKLEGFALLHDGRALIVNDNDGVDDNSGETQLIELPALFN